MSFRTTCTSLLCLVLLAACGREPAPAQPRAPQPAAQASLAGCMPLKDWVNATHGSLRVDRQAQEERVLVGFTIVQDGRTVSDATPVSQDAISAAVLDEDDWPRHVTVCADRWFILDLPGERGGFVVIGERVNGGLSMRLEDYEGGDEDALTIALVDGRPYLGTRQEKPHPIQPDDATGRLAPGTGAPRALTCTSEDRQGNQLLTLRLDSTGRLTSVDYTCVMPGGTSCHAAASRGDGETTWTAAPGGVDIHWNELGEGVGPLGITHREGRFTVDASTLPPVPFCGQSSQFADALSLKPGDKTCQDVRWPAR